MRYPNGAIGRKQTFSLAIVNDRLWVGMRPGTFAIQADDILSGDQCGYPPLTSDRITRVRRLIGV
jgi:hypothetical protein